MKGRKFFKGLFALMVIASVVRNVKRRTRLDAEARSHFAAWRRHAHQPEIV